MISDSSLKFSPPRFKGDDSDYEAWRFSLRAYFARYGMLEELDAGTISEAKSREVYYIIASAVEGAAVATVMQGPEGNGLVAWKSLEERYDSKRVTAKFALLRKLMSSKCKDVSEAESWIHEKMRAARKLTGMGVTIEEVALLGIVDNLPAEMAGVADIVLANGTTDLTLVKRLVLEKQDALQRMEVDTVANLSTNAGRNPACVWRGQGGHWAASCPQNKSAKTSKGKGGSYTGKGGPDNWGRRATCYLCSKEGHVVRNCPQLAHGKGHSQAQATVAHLLHAAAENAE